MKTYIFIGLPFPRNFIKRFRQNLYLDKIYISTKILFRQKFYFDELSFEELSLRRKTKLRIILQLLFIICPKLVLIDKCRVLCLFVCLND